MLALTDFLKEVTSLLNTIFKKEYSQHRKRYKVKGQIVIKARYVMTNDSWRSVLKLKE